MCIRDSYIGMIGSRAKCRTILDKLAGDGFGEADLGRIHAPIGLELGGPTPSEIALAILCLLYTSPSPRDRTRSRMPSSA